MMSKQLLVCLGVAVLAASLPAWSARGQSFSRGVVSLEGTVEAISRDTLTVRTADGDTERVLFQGTDERGVSLSDGTLLAVPTEIRVEAEFPATGLKPGQVVRYRCRLNRAGKTEAPVDELAVLEGGELELGVTGEAVDAPPASRSGYADSEVCGTVLQINGRRLVIDLPPERSFHRNRRLAVSLGESAVARLESKDSARIEPGGRVLRLEAIRLTPDDLVARTIEVRNPVAETVADKGDEVLERKYRSLSDIPPAEPRLVRSPHFAFMTDVSDREWAVIRDKLERMVQMLERFLGRRMTGVVEGFVARDLDTFPPGMIDDEYGVAKIRRGEGVCVNSRLGALRHARLYSCSDHGVIQHECVHGLCHLTFGSTGPTWLAEGLAELGNYWREGDQAIDLPPPVIAYLQNESPKRKLLEIAVAGRAVGDTWEDYAWRWALCHLLAKSPNYCNRFVPLAIGLMEERPGVSFETVYGPVAKEISFEYDQFLNTLGNGYRSDLTQWPWKAKFQKLSGTGDVTVKIAARAGWQASRVVVEDGQRYEVVAEGTWKIAEAGRPVDADGEPDGRGRLVAALFSDFSLSPEISLGRSSTLDPPGAGQLFLRCQDAWTELGDNDGELAVTIRRLR